MQYFMYSTEKGCTKSVTKMHSRVVHNCGTLHVRNTHDDCFCIFVISRVKRKSRHSKKNCFSGNQYYNSPHKLWRFQHSVPLWKSRKFTSEWFYSRIPKYRLEKEEDWVLRSNLDDFLLLRRRAFAFDQQRPELHMSPCSDSCSCRSSWEVLPFAFGRRGTW